MISEFLKQIKINMYIEKLFLIYYDYSDRSNSPIAKIAYFLAKIWSNLSIIYF